VAIPKGYLPLEGSELSIAADAPRIGPEDPAKVLSAVIRVNEQGRDQVATFLVAQGLRTAATGRTDEIVVIGTAAQINAAFGIELMLHKWARRIWRCYEGFPSSSVGDRAPRRRRGGVGRARWPLDQPWGPSGWRVSHRRQAADPGHRAVDGSPRRTVRPGVSG
jgi:hypothetical protein